MLFPSPKIAKLLQLSQENSNHIFDIFIVFCFVFIVLIQTNLFERKFLVQFSVWNDSYNKLLATIRISHVYLRYLSIYAKINIYLLIHLDYPMDSV